MEPTTVNTNTNTLRASTLLLALAAATFFCFGLRTISNSAFWMHLASGRVIAEQGIPAHDPFSFATAPDQPWVNPTWLYDLTIYRAWQLAGSKGIVFLNALLGLLAFLAALATGRKNSSATPAALTLLLCAWLIAPTFQVEPQTLALFLAGLTMLILNRKANSPAAWFFLIPVQLLWTNCHESFLLAPLLALATCAQETISNKRKSSVPLASALSYSHLGLAVTLFVVTFLNPYGIKLHLGVLATATNPMLGVLTEWVSPFAAEFTTSWARHISTILLAIVAAAFIFVRERLPVASTVSAVIGAFLLVLSPRYAAFSALLVAPFAAMSIEHLSRLILDKQGDGSAPDAMPAKFGMMLLAACCIATLFAITTNRYYLRIGSASSFGAGLAQGLNPTAACDRVIQRPDFPKRAINLAMDGGYLAWKLPGRQIFTDTRAPLHGAAFYQDLGRSLLGQGDSWTNFMSRWEPEAVILNCNWPGAGASLRHLVDDKVWALVYFDGISAILVLRTTEYRALISDLEIQQAGLTDLQNARVNYARKDGRIFRSAIPSQLLAAGTPYLALGRFREASSIYELITPRLPAYATGWINLGVCRLEQHNVDDAIQALIVARRLKPDNPLAWLWLNRAFTDKGLTREADEALAKARRLNKPMADAFMKLGQTETNAPAATGKKP